MNLIVLRQALQALLRSAYDHRQCPHCHLAILPLDATAREAETAYHQLRAELDPPPAILRRRANPLDLRS